MTKEQFIHEIIPLSDKIYRLAFRYLKDKEMARDVVQAIYLKLWEKRDELQSSGNQQAYVFTMAKNACLDKIKLRKNNVDIMDYQQTVEPAFENTEYVMIIKKIIETLPDQQKLIIELRDIEGFTFEEIAQMLDLSVNNIRVSLSLARKKVREDFQKIYNYGLRKN